MRQKYAVGVWAVILLLASSPALLAQMHPGRSFAGRYGGYGGYGDFGGYGAWGAYTSALNSATTRNIAEQDHLAGMNAAMQQNAMMQSGIRNTMMTQAQTRTQDIYSQRQSNRDWWFQVEQQQSAQRQAAAARAPMGTVAMAPVAGFDSALSAVPQPEAATDIIKWLPVLCDPRFAEQRATVEAPYRRTPKGQPTVADYENMIDATKQMKAILGQMTAQISAQEYLGAEKFIDQLAAEARGRIEQNQKPTEQPAK